MSGTSLDGVDGVIADLSPDAPSLVRVAAGEPFDPDFKAELLSLNSPGPNELHRAALAANQLAGVYARVVERLLQIAAVQGIHRQDIIAIGAHGQTVRHQPQAFGTGYTLQLNNPALLAELTGMDVIADFRNADVAAGGQGAPLVPVFHAALVRNLPRPLAVVNIGGVGNVTWIGDDDSLLAFDTGPGNGPIDDWCARRAGQRYDKDGTLAAAGTVDRGRVARFGEHLFFARVPPKSLDRGDFNDAWTEGLSVADGAATLTRGTARAIALAARHFPAPVSQWVICGGGARNPTLLRAIAEETGDRVVTAADLGWDGDALEAQAFAFLAVRSLRGLPLTFPGTTGVPRPMTGGRLSEP